MYECLTDVRTPSENVLHLVWLNVLPLGQLEYWLFPVDDL